MSRLGGLSSLDEPIIDAAVATLAPDMAVIVGGTLGSGGELDTAYVVEAGEVYAAPAPVGARSGAAAAVDPVDGRMYVFGGDDTADLDVLWNPGAVSAPALLVPTEVAVELEETVPGSWYLRAIADAVTVCEGGGSACRAETVLLRWPTPIFNNLDRSGIRVRVRRDGAPEFGEAMPIGRLLWSESDTPESVPVYRGWTLAAYTLPAYLASDDEIRVEIELTLPQRTASGQLTPEELGYGGITEWSYGAPTEDCSSATAWSYAGMPLSYAWDRPPEMLNPTAPLTRLAVRAAAGAEPIVPGKHEADCANFGEFAAGWPFGDGFAREAVGEGVRCGTHSTASLRPQDLHIRIVPYAGLDDDGSGGVVGPETHIVPGLMGEPPRLTARVWTDSCLDIDVKEQLNDYGRDNLTADLDWLESLIGESPISEIDILATRPYDGRRSGIYGWAHSGTLWLNPAATPSGLPDEALFSGFDLPINSTIVHELAHQWIGLRGRLPTEAVWLREGAPTLLERMRYPSEYPGAETLLLGLDFVMTRSRDGLGDESLRQQGFLESEDPTLQYHGGAYAVAGLLALHEGHVGGDGDTSWEALATALWPDDLSGIQALSEADLADELDAYVGGFDYYDEWIVRPNGGFPLVRLADVREDGDNIVADVEQVQDLLAPGIPAWSRVPLHLGCVYESDGLGPGFPGCTVEDAGQEAPPYILEGASATVVLGPADAYTWPLRAAVIDSYQMLPGHIGAFAVQAGEGSPLTEAEIPVVDAVAPTWGVWCGDAVVSPCIGGPLGVGVDGDADGDGHPAVWVEEGNRQI